MSEPRERALLVGISPGGAGRAHAEASLEELGLLARAAGARVVGSMLQERQKRDPATLIGKGKVVELGSQFNVEGDRSPWPGAATGAPMPPTAPSLIE